LGLVGHVRDLLNDIVDALGDIPDLVGELPDLVTHPAAVHEIRDPLSVVRDALGKLHGLIDASSCVLDVIRNIFSGPFRLFRQSRPVSSITIAHLFMLLGEGIQHGPPTVLGELSLRKAIGNLHG
jgi:hypothetical protein